MAARVLDFQWGQTSTNTDTFFSEAAHPHCHTYLTMPLRSTNDSSSIFQDGKLKPGIYKIQNIQSETYLDIEVHLRELCCRPSKDLGEGRGFVCRYPLICGSYLMIRSGKSKALGLDIR